MSSLIPSLAANTGEAIDMPVDPNEPTYCLCHQVSYGEMIACDKTDVSKLNSKSRLLTSANKIINYLFPLILISW